MQFEIAAVAVRRRVPMLPQVRVRERGDLQPRVGDMFHAGFSKPPLLAVNKLKSHLALSRVPQMNA